jgi:hypothetical protein
MRSTSPPTEVETCATCGEVSEPVSGTSSRMGDCSAVPMLTRGASSCARITAARLISRTISARRANVVFMLLLWRCDKRMTGSGKLSYPLLH